MTTCHWTIAVYRDGCLIGEYGYNKADGTLQEWLNWVEREDRERTHNIRCQEHGLFNCEPCYPVVAFESQEEATARFGEVRALQPKGHIVELRANPNELTTLC